MFDTPIGRGANTPRDRGFLAVVVAVLAVAGVVLGLVFHVLLRSTNDAYRRAERSNAIAETVLRVDALEWRAIAGEPIGEVSQAFQQQVRAVTALLRASDDSSGSHMSGGIFKYLEAVTREFASIRVGDVEGARAIIDELVDPAFDAAIDQADELRARQIDAAVAAERSVERLAWVMIVSFVVVTGAGLWFVLSLRDRRISDRYELATNRRFRSLVESSDDVITVISDSHGLTLMSPSLGVLGLWSSSPNPESVAEWMSPDSYVQWLDLDARVRDGQEIHHFEFHVTRPDGVVAHVEATGRPLAGEPDQRVWVWRDISERRAMEDQLNHQAFHDSLTGVANRALLHDRADHALSRAARTGEPVSLLFCDLDNFKTVNDALGHSFGDALLAIVTKRISACVRVSDTLARLGGDEFAVLAEGTDLETASALAERILSVVSYQVELGDRDLFPSMSIGVATMDPGMTTEELLRRADVAMYSAKRSGKGRVEIYHGDGDSDPSELLTLQSELRQGIHAGELALVYQPTVSLTDGSVEAVEALVRWHHPTRGVISPATFIPLAEESGSIAALGKWVLTEACRAAVTLVRPDGGAVTMHVNVSPQQLHDSTFVPFVTELLVETGLPPHQLVLEVTEGSLLANPTAIDRLLELHGLGIRLAIDDFGTGYASISYLQRLPIDILKIDRAFVSGDALPPSERRAFLHTIIAMAQNLNLTSVAEGIETLEQLQQVQDLGCDHGQGFLWAHPVGLELVRALIIELTDQATINQLGAA